MIVSAARYYDATSNVQSIACTALEICVSGFGKGDLDKMEEISARWRSHLSDVTVEVPSKQKAELIAWGRMVGSAMCKEMMEVLDKAPWSTQSFCCTHDRFLSFAQW